MNTEYFEHSGTPHEGSTPHSGRHPWGSGENPYQHGSDEFMAERLRLKKEGFTETQIAYALNMSTKEYRDRIMIAKEEINARNIAKTKELLAKGWTKTAIADELGVTEGAVRSWIKNIEGEQQGTVTRKTKAGDIAEYLKQQVEEKGIIDVGIGVERELGVAETTLSSALKSLEDQGYAVLDINVEQMTNPGKSTRIHVLAPEGTTGSDVHKKIGEVQSVTPYDSYLLQKEDPHPGFKRTKYGMYEPVSVDSSRVAVLYGDEGGKQKDGIIEIKRGVEDLSLGKSNYAQVRIGVDGTHFLKGVAIYGEDDEFPEGCDIIFNTNKPSGTPKMISGKGDEVFKKLKDDPDNPFGASIKSIEKAGQRFYTDSNGDEQLSPINIVNSEGDWGDWSKTISSQMLSKQPKVVVERQLEQTFKGKMDEYRDILQITNPSVKQKFLQSFSEDCDASAVHLKADAFPGQASHLLLPLKTIKDDEVYAPNYEDGEMVVLIRYPHGGTFEMPRLKVNNGNAEGKKLIGNAVDAIGISQATAAQLSGADFDGDTATVIPVSRGGVAGKIKSDKPLRELRGDPDAGIPPFETDMYKVGPDSPKYDVGPKHGFHKQNEMGKISNLITDMTIMGAGTDELARAVKHSMVVIDAEKHHLDWRQSYKDNRIAELKIKYQGGKDRGAATIISKASSEERTDPRKVQYSSDENHPNVKNGIDVITGEKVYRDDPQTYNKPIYKKEYVIDPATGKPKTDPLTGKRLPKELVYITDPETGARKKVVDRYKETPKTRKSTKMAEKADAMELVSNVRAPVELLYADYANKLKALANTARKEMISTTAIQYDKSANVTYKDEVDSLMNKLDAAKRNAPRERMAQMSATAIFKMKKTENPDMTDEQQKKIKSKTLAEQRVRYNAKRSPIEITDKEWEAIQAGAIRKTTLDDIIKYVEEDKLRERAMPKDSRNVLTETKIGRIKTLSANGYTNKQIAELLGLSVTTINKAIKS